MATTIPTHFNFARDVVERWAKERPDALALWCVSEPEGAEQKLTFREVAEKLKRAASFFRQLGLKRGDRVLTIMPRVPQWWIGMLGLIRLGVVPIPGTPLLTGRDIKYRLEASEATALITDEEGAAKAEGLQLTQRICIDGERRGWTSFDAGLRQADPDFERQVQERPVGQEGIADSSQPTIDI